MGDHESSGAAFSRPGTGDRPAALLVVRDAHGGRATCGDSCEGAARETQDRTAYYASGPERLRELRASGVEPVGEAARARISSQQKQRQREENGWNAAHSEPSDPEAYRRGVLPAIQGVPIRELARRTGLSVAYCARVRRGDEVPHERWWSMLLVRDSTTPR